MNKLEENIFNKLLSNHLIDFLIWAKRENKDLNEGNVSLREINNFTRYWIDDFNDDYIRKQRVLEELYNEKNEKICKQETV